MSTTQALTLCIEAGVPVLLWGSPGTGKSKTVEALGTLLARQTEVVIASLREPADFGGLPIVSDGSVTFAPPAWAQRLAAAGRGLLFLDEINTAPPAVQAALLRVVLDRVVGDLALPPAVSIVAAANPVHQAAGGWQLSAPLANRFCHLQWDFDFEAWSKGMLTDWSTPPQTAALPSGWEASEAHARAQVVAFLRTRPALANAGPSNTAASGGAWPSPRTWTMAARLWGAALAAQAPQAVRLALVTGCVGEAGLEFIEWASRQDLPDPSELLAHPTAFVLPRRGDQAYAVLAAVVAETLRQPTPERWQACWAILARAASQDAADIAIMAARQLFRSRPAGYALPQEIIHDFLPLLQTAGLV